MTVLRYIVYVDEYGRLRVHDPKWILMLFASSCFWMEWDTVTCSHQPTTACVSVVWLVGGRMTYWLRFTQRNLIVSLRNLTNWWVALLLTTNVELFYSVRNCFVPWALAAVYWKKQLVKIKVWHMVSSWCMLENRIWQTKSRQSVCNNYFKWGNILLHPKIIGNILRKEIFVILIRK